MTYAEVKDVLAKLENFRQLVGRTLDEQSLLVTTEAHDHLLREAILCIEALEAKTRYPNVPLIPDFPVDPEWKYFPYADPNDFDWIRPTTTLPYRQGAVSFAELAKGRRQGMPGWKYELFKGK